MRVLIVQPPRKYWPYTSEGDNFLLQQALPALAGALRAVDGVEVHVLDCMPLHLGWRSLADEIKRIDPDVIGSGENHALYASEALRFFKMCKEVAPRAFTVAGGGHFSNLAHRYAKAGTPIDAIVVGEGEVTFVELVKELGKAQPSLHGIDGLVFWDGEKMVRNPARALVHDLDALPLPAYDMMPMELYGKSRYLFSPGGTTIHHSRGCVSKCSFCAWWTTMADRTWTPPATPSCARAGAASRWAGCSRRSSFSTGSTASAPTSGWTRAGTSTRTSTSSSRSACSNPA